MGWVLEKKVYATEWGPHNKEPCVQATEQDGAAHNSALGETRLCEPYVDRPLRKGFCRTESWAWPPSCVPYHGADPKR